MSGEVLLFVENCIQVKGKRYICSVFGKEICNERVSSKV